MMSDDAQHVPSFLCKSTYPKNQKVFSLFLNLSSCHKDLNTSRWFYNVSQTGAMGMISHSKHYIAFHMCKPLELVPLTINYMWKEHYDQHTLNTSPCGNDTYVIKIDGNFMVNQLAPSVFILSFFVANSLIS